MEPQTLESRLTEVKEFLKSRDSITMFEAGNQPFSGFVIEESDLVSFAEDGIERGATDFYLLKNRTDEEELDLVGLCYFYDGRAHSCYLQSDQRLEAGEDATGIGADSHAGFGRDESEEEKQRKEEIADELLEEYEEYIDESDLFDIKNRLDRMRLDKLLRIQERVEQEAKRDPEEEKRLAREVYEDERFHRQFNQTDTEMLLDELDVEFNQDYVRIDEVHKRAKSLLKINK